MRTYRYLHLDVFTDRPLTGNQLAVYPDADGLDTERMQRIAQEMAFSETTFVFPPEAAGTDVRMRIFTPGSELPIAGHPTVGSAFALAREGRIGPERSTFVFGLGIGPTPVGLEWEGERLRFVWMHQPVPAFGPTPSNLGELAAALAVEEGDIRDTGLPVQQASSGVPALFVPLVSRRAVDAAAVDRGPLRRFFAAASLPEMPVFVFSLEKTGDDATAYSRMFAPLLGIQEDAATGSASGPLGAYLVRHGAVAREEAGQMVSLQGVKMGRPSRIHISISAHDGVIAGVRVGGQSVLVGEGQLYL